MGNFHLNELNLISYIFFLLFIRNLPPLELIIAELFKFVLKHGKIW